MKPTRIRSLSPRDALSVVLRLPRFAHLDAAGCLVWSGCRDHSGYGKMTTGKIRTGAHRLAWLAIKGRQCKTCVRYRAKHGVYPEPVGAAA